MKKYLSVILLIVMVLSLVACNKDKSDSDKKDSESETKATQQRTEVPTDPQTEEATEAPTEEKVNGRDVIDFETLYDVEANDNFAVKIESAQLVEGLFDNGSTVIDPNGEDGIELKIKNNTSAKIDEITIYLICSSASGEICDLGMLTTTPFMADGKATKVKAMGTSTAGLAANTSDLYDIQCKKGSIKNVNAIVYSYVDENGKEVVNENADKWLSYTVYEMYTVY